MIPYQVVTRLLNPSQPDDAQLRLQRCSRNHCRYSHDKSTPFAKLLAHLGSARRTLDIAVFTITHNLIRDAILEAHRRGVTVRLITDDTQV